MNKQSATILLVLVLLTLAGLILVSNLISENKPPQRNTAALMTGSPKATPTPSARPISNNATVATDMHFAQAQLDSLSDAIQSNDWAKSQTLFASFELKDRRLPSPQLRHPDISPLLQDFFDLYVVQLERAIIEKHAKAAFLAINQLASIINETTARFVKRATPVEVQRLHHLVHEMTFWQAAGDDKMLRVRAAALREAWNNVGPLIRARKQGDVVAAQFDALLSQTTAAESASQMTLLLPELNHNLAQMDLLFEPNGSLPKESGGNQDDN